MSYIAATDNRPNTSELDINILVKKWFEGVKKRDVHKLLSLLHPDMELTVPFQTEIILGNVNALQTFKAFDESVNNFNYKNVLIDGNIAALYFEADINGEHLQGVDFFYFNADGQVEKIEVMARPLAAIQYLHEAVNGCKI
jgi:hypothetical protein